MCYACVWACVGDACMHACMCVYVWCVNACVWAYVCLGYIHECVCLCVGVVYMCVGGACMYACVCVGGCMHACMWACVCGVCACAYVCEESVLVPLTRVKQFRINPRFHHTGIG